MSTETVRAEWFRRIEAEYRSAALAGELVVWLIRVGASPDLIDDAQRIVGDELVHARMSHVVYTAAGGQTPPEIDRDSLALPRHADQRLELDVLRTAVRIFCLGETIAVPLFSHLRASCTQPSARQALDRILRDEVRHREFGWELLAMMLEDPHGSEYRELIAAELPDYFALLEAAYGSRGQDEAPLLELERDWGLAPASEYAAILERTLLRDFALRFKDLDIDAPAAWERRPR